MSRQLHILSLALSFALSGELFGQRTEFKHPGGDGPRARYVRALTCYVIEGIHGRIDPSCQNGAIGSIDTSGLPDALSEGLLATIKPETGELDPPSLRDWWSTWSYALRQRRGHAVIVDSLQDFKTSTGFRNWDFEIIPLSQAKQKTRVIYRSPSTMTPGMSVSETYDSQVGDLTAKILETEIIIDRRDGSPNADFYVYNENGQLATTSHFPVGERPAPLFCLGCHYKSDHGSFERFR